MVKKINIILVVILTSLTLYGCGSSTKNARINSSIDLQSGEINLWQDNKKERAINKNCNYYDNETQSYSGNTSNSEVLVKGYYKKNGTYVAPYYRTAPDKTKSNNYSSKGNVNPHTGKMGSQSITSSRRK